MRLTKEVRQQLLQQNGGFEVISRYQGHNFQETRRYVIEKGSLMMYSCGKTKENKTFDVCKKVDEKKTHQFLKKHEKELWKGKETYGKEKINNM